jgi:hypothetical protein
VVSYSQLPIAAGGAATKEEKNLINTIGHRAGHETGFSPKSLVHIMSEKWHRLFDLLWQSNEENHWRQGRTHSNSQGTHCTLALWRRQLLRRANEKYKCFSLMDTFRRTEIKKVKKKKNEVGG